MGNNGVGPFITGVLGNNTVKSKNADYEYADNSHFIKMDNENSLIENALIMPQEDDFVNYKRKLA